MLFIFFIFFLLRLEPDDYKSLLLLRLMPLSFTGELIYYIMLVAGQICNLMCLQYFHYLKAPTVEKMYVCCHVTVVRKV